MHAECTHRKSISRSRWAAVGAAIAVVLGAGGITTTNLLLASGNATPSAVVPITPTRVLDTRVGLGLQGPFTSLTPRDLQLTGAIPTPAGAATVVPNGATGVVLNVTAVQPTAPGFVSVRPAGTAGPPTTSNLNVSAGDIVPNAVTVSLSAGGAIELTYDAFSVAGPTTNLLVDVVAYLVPAPTGGSPGPAGPAGPVGPAGPAGPPGEPLAGVQFRESTSFTTHNSTLSQAWSVTASFPASGWATVSADFFFQINGAGTTAVCHLSADAVASSGPNRSASSGTESLIYENVSITRTFAVTAGSTRTFYLSCLRPSGTGGVAVVNPVMVVQYAPTRLTP